MPKSFSDLPQLFSNAYQWLSKSRKNHPPDSDFWNLRRTWHSQAEAVMESFRTGAYRFDLQSKIRLSCGETIAIWSSQDALVIKVLTSIIQKRLKPFLLKTCYLLKGHGGLKGAVLDVINQLPKYKFFCKTDVHSYYDSVDHYTVLMKLHDYIDDRIIIGYVWQFLNRCVEWGGLYQGFRKGIPRGSSLSPFLGAFYLLELDQKMEKLEVKYIRYMDDIVILAPTRWKLKKAIRVLNQTFNELCLEKHPNKTLIGRIERGFDFLGYHFTRQGLGLAEKTVTNFIYKALQLYEQEPGEVMPSARLGEYLQRWVRWTLAGIPQTCLSKCDLWIIQLSRQFSKSDRQGWGICLVALLWNYIYLYVIIMSAIMVSTEYRHPHTN